MESHKERTKKWHIVYNVYLGCFVSNFKNSPFSSEILMQSAILTLRLTNTSWQFSPCLLCSWRRSHSLFASWGTQRSTLCYIHTNSCRSLKQTFPRIGSYVKCTRSFELWTGLSSRDITHKSQTKWEYYRPFTSYPEHLFQNESVCKTYHMKMSLICIKMIMKAEHISISLNGFH